MDSYVQFYIALVFITIYDLVSIDFFAYIWLSPTSLVIYEFTWLFLYVFYDILVLYFFRPTKKDLATSCNDYDITMTTFTTNISSSTFTSSEISSN